MIYHIAELLSITKEKGQEGLVTLQTSPLYSFMYALKSSEARRQYPKRLKMLFDYLKLQGQIEELQKQVEELTEKTNNNDYLLKAKLQEKDDALTTLSDQVMKLMAEVNEMKRRN